jgi:eukaryotic-like serine/threonine-protein kinase
MAMALVIGTKLGSYQIEAAIGAGGMGEVYRARDNRLGRIVAVKVLPEGEYAGDELRRRFEREARVLSSLSHPHICAIYDVGEEQGVRFIVMEYLEGETLAKRLERGPLAVPQVLQYGIEIAAAIEKAHHARIIHRDLKPGNIMLTKSGIKLLDFGLARITQPDAPLVSAPTALPTEHGLLTGVHAILGTLQYMAPEQLEGRETDTRTDIFAFGTVLYEMTTGRCPFLSKSQASLIAAILSSEPPPLLELSPLSPPSLDRVIRTCLAKDPEERWQTAHDLRLQLQWIKDGASQVGVPAAVSRRRNRERTAWATAVALLLVFATLTVVSRFLRPAPQPQRKLMFAVDLPPGYKLSEDGTSALSPDGASIAYAATDVKGKASVWVRSLDSLNARRLDGSGSDAAYYSFVWTPDSKAVVAAVNGKLMRLSVAGGANEVLCDKFEALPMTINTNGTILAWTAPPTKVFSVSPDDCALRPLTSALTSGSGYAYPHFLPDGSHFLFAAVHKNNRHDILVGSLKDSGTRMVIHNASLPKYLDSGYILFSRDGFLMAQKFNAASQSTSGEPFLAYPNQLQFYAAFGWAAFDASRNGFISAKEQKVLSQQLRWYNRSGQGLQTLTEPELTEAPRLEGDGKRALLSIFNPRTHGGDLWSLDLEHGTRRRETFQDRPGQGWATWLPNGERIIYSVLVGTQVEIFIKNAGSSGNGQMLQTGLDGSKEISDVSPDGNSIVYAYTRENGTDASIYGQSLTGGKPFLIAPAMEDDPARISPDGRWVAFQSNESGSLEIVVRPFAPSAGASTQVSFGGGYNPRWSRDGKELFYRTNDWHIVAVPVLDLNHPRFGKPVTLFQLPENSEYDTVDGKRFLVNEPSGSVTVPLFIIANWNPEPKSE